MPLSVFKKLNASLNPYNQGYFVSTRCLISIHLISAGANLTLFSSQVTIVFTMHVRAELRLTLTPLRVTCKL